MIPIKTVVDKANTKITAGGLTDLEYTQLSSTDVFLDRAGVKVVANFASLPSAANNEGIMYYVTNEAAYYFSDGAYWIKDFTSDSEPLGFPTMFTWGSGSAGQLGDNTTTNRSSPVTVVGGIMTWSQVSGGTLHSLALTSTGIAYAWGTNNFGQLGDGTVTGRSSPVTVVGGITNWSQLAAGPRHSLGVTSTGIAYAWGTNYRWQNILGGGQLGDNTTTNRSSPVTIVGGITIWSQLTGGGNGSTSNHSLGITSTGIAYGWGSNQYGFVGDNTTVSKSSPVTVVGGITTWSQVSAANYVSLGLTSAGIAYGWGFNSYGQVGDGTTTGCSSPVTVVGGITTWSQVSAATSASHCLGLTSAGIAYGWGRNTFGQLGDNTKSSRLSPVTVVGGITNWSQLSAGSYHCLGLTSAGIVYGWGNAGGSIGDGTASSRLSPVTVVGGITTWSQIGAGNHSLGLAIYPSTFKGFV